MFNKVFSIKNRDVRPVFVLGTGRCGTHLFYELFNAMTKVQAYHILHLDGDSFYRYAKWNELDVDLGDFIAYRNGKILNSINNSSVYVESNPYLSFHIDELYNSFNARFIFIIRNPMDVVNSHVKKGWYAEEPVRIDDSKPVGFQYSMNTNHFLGRIIPGGEEYKRWINLSRIGKISWMWDKVNTKIYEDLYSIPEKDKFFLKVEHLDYLKYKEILQYFSINNPISNSTFNNIIQQRPGKSSSEKQSPTWTVLEQEEFEKETANGRALFQY